GDGTPFTCSATLSKDGEFPVYSQLYNNHNGSLLSWLEFTNRANSDFNGLVSWIKPSSPANTRYPSGFAVSAECLGSAYASTNALLSFSNGYMSFSGGEMGYGFVDAVRLTTSGQLVNLSSNALWFASIRANGVFGGWAVNPATGRSATYSGVAF